MAFQPNQPQPSRVLTNFKEWLDSYVTQEMVEEMNRLYPDDEKVWSLIYPNPNADEDLPETEDDEVELKEVDKIWIYDEEIELKNHNECPETISLQ